MSTVDIIILLCFIPGVIRGLSKGFLEQGLTLVRRDGKWRIARSEAGTY